MNDIGGSFFCLLNTTIELRLIIGIRGARRIRRRTIRRGQFVAAQQFVARLFVAGPHGEFVAGLFVAIV